MKMRIPRGTVVWVLVFLAALPCLLQLVGCATAKPNGTIKPGDVLHIDFEGFPEPETRTCVVDSEGKIKLPYLNGVPAAGLSLSELEGAILTGYSKFHTPPNFEITVTRIHKP